MQIAENVRIDRFDIAMAMKQLTKHNAIVRIESEQGHTSGSDTIRLCEIQSNSAMLVYFVGSKD